MNIAAAANETLAHNSNLLVYGAMAVYTLAFLAHMAEWVFGSRSKVGRTAAALTVEAVEPATVTVRSAAKGGTAVLDRPAVVTRTAPGGRDVPDGPGAAGGTAKGDLYGRIAISLTVLAWALHVGGVLTRALSVQRAPWGNMYEFSTTFAAVAVSVYLILLVLKKNVRWIGLPLVTTVLLDLGLAVSVLYTASDQLVPALHSYWLWIHVSCAIISGAVLYMGAVATLLFLFRDRYEDRLGDGRVAALHERLDTLRRSGKDKEQSTFGLRVRIGGNDVLSRLPAAASLDKFAYRVNATVFPLWTFTIIAGAIWAEAAWGRYWGWDPKEVWSFITWVAYACYLHARATAGWKGRKAAWLGLIAFACYLFNYYGVNIFVTGLHSYAGV
ncbi:c-type cytochrome biogenesis protein CcsB [Streptomyces sp. NBC_01525]|uniref:C-type cytochrome biogenesis protein CcsB n=1 Tax=Streptomyces benahoarensis TaxID=2595054 RepID=A0A553ZPD5_9ACTN|nr:c-type cytochrome biogenesis protein CcsB [Streptomyces benahoarensis]TSB29346.1 c-type cytochrome biogenesis protein CcsB [Streptomyces benahoarensis]TSB43255.1 c-type cytochrome biogenesis protein CcsB [Streptomyces benahoarensis]